MARKGKLSGTLPRPPIGLQLNSEQRSRRRAIVVLEQLAEDALAFHAAGMWQIGVGWSGGSYFDFLEHRSRPRQPRFPVLPRSLVNNPTGRTSRFGALRLTANSDAGRPNCALCFGVRTNQNLGELSPINPLETTAQSVDDGLRARSGAGPR